MLITGDRLREIAGSFLDTLDREGITTLGDLEQKAGKVLRINKKGSYIEIKQSHHYLYAH